MEVSLQHLGGCVFLCFTAGFLTVFGFFTIAFNFPVFSLSCEVAFACSGSSFVRCILVSQCFFWVTRAPPTNIERMTEAAQDSFLKRIHWARRVGCPQQNTIHSILVGSTTQCQSLAPPRSAARDELGRMRWCSDNEPHQRAWPKPVVVIPPTVRPACAWCDRGPIPGSQLRARTGKPILPPPPRSKAPRFDDC